MYSDDHFDRLGPRQTKIVKWLIDKFEVYNHLGHKQADTTLKPFSPEDYAGEVLKCFRRKMEDE